MRRQTRLIAALLLIATVVSVFAVLPAFAANDAGSKVTSSAKPKTGITVLTDLAKQGGITQNNKATNAAGTSVPTLSKTEESGVPVWIHDWEDTLASESVAGGNWWNVSGLGFGTRIRDDKGSTDANYGRLGGSKNTDYIVLDFDIATDTALPYMTYVNTRMYGTGAVTSLGNVSYYPAWGVDSDGRFYVSNADGDNKQYATAESDGKYTHVTLVWDFHTAGDGSITNLCYVYINGVYAGNINSFISTTAAVYFMRVQLSTLHNSDYEQAKYANFTLKRFDAGFEGVISEEGKLGNADVTLADIDELSYCMENAPGTIADIKRVVDGKTTTINVTNPDDLSGDLLDGDVVIAYTDLAALKAAYVVKMVAGEGGTDVSANITWVDKNGIEIGTEGALFATKPTILDVPSAALWVSLNLAGTAMKSASSWGAKPSMAEKNESGKWVVYDPLYANRYSNRSNGVQIMLFGDYTSYGRGEATTVLASFTEAGVTATSTSSSYGNFATNTILDLNGYTLSVDPKSGHWMTISADAMEFTIKNGNLHRATTSDSRNLIASTTTSFKSTFTLENLYVTSAYAGFSDFRSGTFRLKNSVVDMQHTLVTMKAVANGHTYFEVIDSEIIYTGSGKSLVEFGQTNENGSSNGGGKSRGGGGNQHVTITGSTIKMGTGNIVSATVYPNGKTHAQDTTRNHNKVNYTIDITDSDIYSYGSLFGVTFNTTNYPTAAAVAGGTMNPLRVTADINVADSSLEVFLLMAGNPAVADYNRGSLTVNANIDNSAVKLHRRDSSSQTTNGGFAQTEIGYKDNMIMTVDLGEGSIFKHTYAARGNDESTYVAPTLVIPEGAKQAYTSIYSGYAIIITKDYTDYTWSAGEESGEFTWNNPADGTTDSVDMSRFATLLDGEAGLYKYTWTVDESNHYTPKAAITFAAKANLTLFDNLYYNLFINKASYDSFAEYISFNGGEYTLNTNEVIVIDEVEYYQIQVKDILPQNAGKTAVSVSFNIPEGAYGEAISHTTELSVLSYVKSTYNGTTDLNSKNLMAAILNYIAAAMDYNSNPEGAAEVRAIFDDVRIQKPGSDAISGTASDVEVSVEFKSELAYTVRALSDTTLSVKYTTTSGTEVAYSVALKEGETFTIKVKAHDFYNGITFTTAAGSTTVSPEGYYNALTDEADKAMMSAIYSYGYAANAYYKAKNPVA